MFTDLLYLSFIKTGIQGKQIGESVKIKSFVFLIFGDSKNELSNGLN